MTNYAPCPFCGATNAEKVKFSWWGGLLGPKILSHVKCLSCAKGYNGKTGKDNTTGIIIYSVIIALVVLAFVVVVFAALGILLFATK
ncbi:MAG: hypothetical protein KBD94_09300 [Pyrinomonadaceae bacterium]|nr:hypothetical protein [Pyrinomonadaceae bacterium]